VRRYFISAPATVDEGVRDAETALTDLRRGFLRAEVQDLRAYEVLSHSAPVLYPGILSGR
jgi:hypothetical protein